MTNYQTAIIDEIKARLTALGTFKVVGEYPEDIVKLGISYPSILVIDEDEDFEAFSSNLQQSNWNISLLFCHSGRINRIKELSDLQASIITAIMDGYNLSGTVATLNLIGIEKGNFTNDLGKDDIGYSDYKTNRKIKFKVGVCNYAG